jgi:hypothetical protein
LTGWKRIVIHCFGASEGFLLDRMNPNWKEQYFGHMLSTDSFFAGAKLKPGYFTAVSSATAFLK